MKKLVLSALLAISSTLAYQASAQYSQFWDNSGTGTPTSGTWDNTSLDWATNVLTASTVSFTNGNFACFAGGSGTIAALTITVPNAITCEGFGDGTIPTNTPTGGTAADTLGAAVTALTFSGAGSINLPAGQWNVECGASANIITVNIPITGPGGFAQHNSGQLSLYGNNTYTGGTAETGGQIINYNSNNSFGTGVITNSGGNAIYLCTNGLANQPILANAWSMNIGTANIWDFGDGNTTLTGPVTLYAGLQLKNNGAAGTPLTISGAIGGAFGMTLECPNGSSIVLSGANTYTGQTVIGLSSGSTPIVSVSNINSVNPLTAMASSSLGDPSSAANGTIAMGNTAVGAELIYTGNTPETSDRVINLAGTTGGAILVMNGTGPLILNNVVSATGNGAKTLTLEGTSTAANAINGCISNSTSATAVTKAQAGNWTLGGTNTFTGTLTVSGGTLTVGGTGTLNKGSFAGAVADNATFVYASTPNQTLSGALTGTGNFDMNGGTGGTTLTLSAATGSTFTGLFTINSGAIAFGADTNLGAPPISAEANDITLNGGNQASIRDTASITLNANRGIFLGPNGGCIQVASGDTLTYNGIISGSGQFQDGLTASTGLGTLALGGSENYTNWTIIDTGTLRLLASASLGNSAGILFSNSPTLDVSAQAPFNLSTTNMLTIINTSNTPTAPAIILGPSGSTVNLGAQTVNLSYNPSGINGDASHPVLTVSQSSLTLNGNTINVTNATGSTLDVGDYALILCTNGFTISTLPTLNYVGSQAPNTTAQLGVVGDMLALQILPTSSYSGSTFTNMAPYPGQTAIYGTPTATFSGTVINGTSYGALGETVNVAIPNVETNSTTISDNTGDFSLTMDINTVPVGTYAVTYSYSGPSLASALDTSTTLIITKATLAIGATNLTKVYGTTLVTNASTAFTNSATQNSETIGSVTLSVNGTPNGSISNAPIGNYILTPSAATGGTFNPNNYTIAYITNSLVIVPLPVGETGTRLYDGTTTATNKILSITNAVGGENVTNVNGGYVTLASSAAGAESITSPGTLTIGGARATNYTTVGMIGSVTVNPLPVGLTGTRYFDGTATAAYSILTITNIIGTDDVSPASGSVTLASSSVGTESIISGGTLMLGGAEAGDYTSVGAIGSVTVTVNQSPTSITFSSANNALTLNWPIDHTGWTLEAQTNSVSTGIGSNWVPVNGSTTNNQMTFTVDPTQGCVFYELLYNP